MTISGLKQHRFIRGDLIRLKTCQGLTQHLFSCVFGKITVYSPKSGLTYDPRKTKASSPSLIQILMFSPFILFRSSLYSLHETPSFKAFLNGRCFSCRACFQTAHFYIDDSSSPRVIAAPSTAALISGNTHTQMYISNKSYHCNCNPKTKTGV